VRLQLARASHAALDLGRARQLCEEALALDPADERVRVELDLMLAEIAFSEHQHAAAVAGAKAVLACLTMCARATSRAGRPRIQGSIRSPRPGGELWRAWAEFVTSVARQKGVDPRTVPNYARGGA
jgi:hypothetical protein